MRDCLLTLGVVLPLSVTSFAQDMKIPEGSNFEPDTYLGAEFWVYEVDGSNGASSKGSSVHREKISTFIDGGKRVCYVEYFSVWGDFCSNDNGGLAFRHGSSSDPDVEIACELTFLDERRIKLEAKQTRLEALTKYRSEYNTSVVWAFDDKVNRWQQMSYTGNYYKQSSVLNGKEFYGQYVPYSPEELWDNKGGIPIECRGETAWIYASPTP
jgi:hypothetical protein